jgi:hypothetical protein
MSATCPQCTGKHRSGLRGCPWCGWDYQAAFQCFLSGDTDEWRGASVNVEPQWRPFEPCLENAEQGEVE